MWLEFSEFFNNPEFYDIKFRCIGGTLYLHKLILARYFEYFKTLFLSQFETPDVIELEVNYEIVELVMNLIYKTITRPQFMTTLYRLHKFGEIEDMIGMLEYFSAIDEIKITWEDFYIEYKKQLCHEIREEFGTEGFTPVGKIRLNFLRGPVASRKKSFTFIKLAVDNELRLLKSTKT